MKCFSVSPIDTMLKEAFKSSSSTWLFFGLIAFFVIMIIYLVVKIMNNNRLKKTNRAVYEKKKKTEKVQGRAELVYLLTAFVISTCLAFISIYVFNIGIGILVFVIGQAIARIVKKAYLDKHLDNKN